MEIAMSSDSGTDIGSDVTSGVESVSSAGRRIRNRGRISFTTAETVLVSPSADTR